MTDCTKGAIKAGARGAALFGMGYTGGYLLLRPVIQACSEESKAALVGFATAMVVAVVFSQLYFLIRDIVKGAHYGDL